MTNFLLSRGKVGVDVMFALGWAVVLGVVWFVVVQPARDDRGRLEQDEAQLVQLHVDSRTLDARVKKERDRLAAVEKELAASQVHLVGVDGLNQRLSSLTRLADSISALGVGTLKVDQITPGTQVHGARYTSVPIRLAGTATYGSAAALLSRLHTEFPDTGVSALTLAHSADVPESDAAFSLELTWYAKPPGAGGPASPVGK